MIGFMACDNCRVQVRRLVIRVIGALRWRLCLRCAAMEDTR